VRLPLFLLLSAYPNNPLDAPENDWRYA
jgi:hypothetical protein